MTHLRKRLNRKQWGWLALGLFYLCLPLDACPDALPGLGTADDAAVMVIVIKKILAEEESK